MKGPFAFDKEYPQMLDTSSLREVSSRQEAESIKKQFGLEVIYHPSVDIPKERILDGWPAFEKKNAVEIEIKELGPKSFTPIWDNHHIRLKIDISKTNTQIKREVFGYVDWGRKIREIEDTRFHFKNLDQVYRVWDLHIKGKPPIEIIKELWPEEYKRKCLENSISGEARESREASAALYEKDMKFRKLREEYEKQGLLNYEMKAFTDIYGDEDEPSSGCIKLYVRVKDSLNRMEVLFQRMRDD